MIMEDILNQNRNCALTKRIKENQIYVAVVAFVLLDLFFSIYDLNCSYTFFLIMLWSGSPLAGGLLKQIKFAIFHDILLL